MTTNDETRTRYGRALTQAMGEVLEEVPAEVRTHLLETVDYWISVGLAIGLNHSTEARRLLDVIEAEEPERPALADHAAMFIEEALA